MELSNETKKEESLVNERISKLTENQLQTFRRADLLAINKIGALNEIDYEWRLINGFEEDFYKKQSKRHLTNGIVFLASAVLLGFLNISLTAKMILFLFAALWIAYSAINEMNSSQNILLKRTILETALVNLRSDIRACGVFDSTADSYRTNNRMCIEHKDSSVPIRKKFYNDYRLSRAKIQSEILDSI